jgi:4a-hydroxytetrahydrobiopterin dehydratase
MHLFEQHCLTETKPQLLSEEKINNYLEEIPQWNIPEDKKNIFRKFKFKNYQKTLSFINAASTIINKENHHPEIRFGYNYCTFYFTTHSAGGITLFDMICAAHIDQLIQEFNV